MSSNPSTPSSESDKQSVGRPQSSLVWRYFDYNPEKDVSVCRISSCDAAINDRNTSNMRGHIRQKHKEEAEKLQKEEEKAKTEKDKRKSSGQKPAKRKSISCTPWATDSEDQVSTTRLLAAAIACSTAAVNIVEHPVWIMLLQKLRPEFNIPGRTKVNTTIDELYVIMKGICVEIFKTSG